MRVAEYRRKTRETDIHVWVNLDGTGEYSVNTGVAFCDHMVRSLATHSLIDMKIEGKGDLRHHIAAVSYTHLTLPTTERV